MEEVGRQNMAMMERALSLFTPFYRPGEAGQGSGDSPQGQGAAFDPAHEIAALRAEVEMLRRQLAEAKSPQPPIPPAEAEAAAATAPRESAKD
jgi:polyhydroxyalkanoate synthesis regulator protein